MSGRAGALASGAQPSGLGRKPSDRKHRLPAPVGPWSSGVWGAGWGDRVNPHSISAARR